MQTYLQVDLPVVTGSLQNGCSHRRTLAVVAPQKTNVFSASFIQRPWERNATNVNRFLGLADKIQCVLQTEVNILSGICRSTRIRLLTLASERQQLKRAKLLVRHIRIEKVTFTALIQRRQCNILVFYLVSLHTQLLQQPTREQVTYCSARCIQWVTRPEHVVSGKFVLVYFYTIFVLDSYQCTDFMIPCTSALRTLLFAGTNLSRI